MTHHLLQPVADVRDPFEDHLLRLHDVVQGARQHNAAGVAPNSRRSAVLLDLHLFILYDARTRKKN